MIVTKSRPAQSAFQPTGLAWAVASNDMGKFNVTNTSVIYKRPPGIQFEKILLVFIFSIVALCVLLAASSPSLFVLDFFFFY